MYKRYEMRSLQDLGDDRGSMCVVEANKEVPFPIRRLFYDFKTTVGGAPRGNHANMNSKFAFICLVGSCNILVNDGENEDEFILDDPKKMLIVDRLVWKKMHCFSEDSVLMVMSDCAYRKDEYIYDYEKFRELSFVLRKQGRNMQL